MCTGLSVYVDSIECFCHLYQVFVSLSSSVYVTCIVFMALASSVYVTCIEWLCGLNCQVRLSRWLNGSLKVFLSKDRQNDVKGDRQNDAKGDS